MADSSNTREEGLSNVLLENYLPYAKSTIVDRAIPFIDGFKPVQRRVLFSMYNNGLLKGKYMKSTRIVGDTMGKYHPHGDSSIYGTLVMMTNKIENCNAPLIDGHGNFGKRWSAVGPAQPRYTEAKLTPLAAELFDGINENAVDMVDNYDNTLKEPALLPTKFPNILINNDSGVAVGISSYIPTFSLRNVCTAVRGILNGTVKTDEDLAHALGVPEFPCGGHVHISDADLVALIKNGFGSIKVTGDYEVYPNKIVITSLPYGVTAEDFLGAIDEAMQTGTKLQGIKEYSNEIGINGLRLVINIRNGYEAQEVLRELFVFTPLKTTISFRTNVIINNKPEELSIRGLIDSWVDFRQNCIKRTYEYRLVSVKENVHKSKAWEKIYDHIKEVVNMIASHNNDDAKLLLMGNYDLDEIQADYILDLKIRTITKDRAKKEIDKLHEAEAKEAGMEAIISDVKNRYKVIYDELGEISDKYGSDAKTDQKEAFTEESLKPAKHVPNNDMVTVVITKNGFIKRLTEDKYALGETYVARNGDYEVKKFYLRNNQYLLVFDIHSICHKILVESIDTGRSNPTQSLLKTVGLTDFKEILYIDGDHDFSYHFNIIFTNGKGSQVRYNIAKGNRAQYKCKYGELTPGTYMMTLEDKFFVKTNSDKAAYINVTPEDSYGLLESFRIARPYKNDMFVKLIPISKVPHIDIIDFNKYTKGYPVRIGDDLLEPMDANEETDTEESAPEVSEPEAEVESEERVVSDEEIDNETLENFRNVQVIEDTSED